MTTNSTSLAESTSASSSVTQIVHPATLEQSLQTLEHSLTVKLNHDNYLVWRKQTLKIIIGNGLKDMINGSRPCPPQVVEGSNEDNPDFTGWHEQNQLIMSWIDSTLSEGLASQIKGHETAYDVWTELEKLFSADLRERGMKLKRKFQKTRKGSSSMEEFIQKIKEISDSLKEIGEHVTEYEQIIHLLGGLEINYGYLIDQVMLNIDSISLEEICRMLLEFDGRLKNKKTESSSSKLPLYRLEHIKAGFSGRYETLPWDIKLDEDDDSTIDLPQASAGPSRPPPTLSSSSDFLDLKCTVCGKIGHTARTCLFSIRPPIFHRNHSSKVSSEGDFSIIAVEVGERIPESLNSSNYLDWSVRVRTHLQERNVWYVIEALPIEKTREKDNDIALAVIYIACGFPTNLCISEIKSARTAWETLAINCKHYETGKQGVDVESFLKAGQRGDWKAVEQFLDLDPNLATARIPHSGSTVLHLAALAGEEDIVEKMVGLMKEEDLEIRGTDGYTALANASAIGNTRIVKYMVEKHKILLSIPIAGTGSELLPVVIAVKYGHKQTALYLYSVTPQEDLTPDGGKINGAALLTYSIRRQYYDITFGLIHGCPRLAVALDHYGQFPLYQLACTPSAFRNACWLKFWQRWIYNFVSIQEIDYASSNDITLNVQDVEDSPGIRQRIVSSLLAVLGIKEVYEMKVLHLQSLGLLRFLCQQMKTLGGNPNAGQVILDSLHEATARGILQFIVGVLEVFPECIWLRDEDGSTIFIKAVQFREAKIFSLIHGFTSKEKIAALVDSYGHNILHKAGLLDEYSEDKISRIQGAALQMQSELQWFEEIEKITSSDRLDLKNNEGNTARQLFTNSHKELMRNAEKWMKDTSNSCIIVAILVVTIMFAAAFTVPGGNHQDTGFPIFLKKKLFKIFIISDAVSLFSSTTSVLTFMGILTSRYAEQDFLKSLPSKMIIGLSTLFISLATMMIAFTATLFIMLRTESWIIIPIVLLASLPVTLYVRLLFPLLYELLMSTYGPSIFDRNGKWSIIG